MNKKRVIQASLVLFTSVTIGFLLVLQARSFARVETLVNRDRNPNVFREIQIFRGVIENLRKEITQTEIKLFDITTKASSFTAIRNEIQQLELLTGEKTVSGEGVRLSIPSNIEAVWFVDLMNEFGTAGAEAVAINSIRLTPDNMGFRAVTGALLIGNKLLHAPFTVEVIGDKKIISSALLQPGGLVVRLEKALPKETISLSEEDNITIPAVENTTKSAGG